MLKAPICIILIDPHNNPVVNKSIVISTFQMRKSRLREVGSQRSHNQEVANLGSEKKAASFKAHDPQHQGRLDFERRNWKNKTLLFLSRWLLPWNHGNKTLEGTTWHERCGIPAPEHVLLTVVSFLRHRQPSRAWATNCGQLPETQKGLVPVCVHSALCCLGGLPQRPCSESPSKQTILTTSCWRLEFESWCEILLGFFSCYSS